MTKNIFVERNMFCPHMDYNSFLADKLTMFKLCNYRIALSKVSHVILRIISNYFIVYETYFIVGEVL
jgi:hypothetical protein